MKWGYILDKKLYTECALLLPVSISLKTEAIRSLFRVRKTGKDPLNYRNQAIVAQNHDARKAVSATLSVLK